MTTEPTINDIKRSIEETLAEDWCPDCVQPPHLCTCKEIEPTYWSDLAELNHAKQIEEWGFCMCEENTNDAYPYPDCPRPMPMCGDCIRPVNECGCLS